jgi:hypothetical protein
MAIDLFVLRYISWSVAEVAVLSLTGAPDYCSPATMTPLGHPLPQQR